MPLIGAHEIESADASPQVYNLHDCCCTHGVLDKLLTLPEYGNMYALSRAYQGPAMDMMLRGFLIDPMERERAVSDIEIRLNGINEFLQLLAQSFWGKGLNYNSSQQISELFYDFLHIPKIIKRDKEEIKFPMDEEALDKLHDKYPLIRIPCAAILACRGLANQLKKLNMELDDGFRCRTSINIAGTNEFRSSNSKSFTGTGGNLQNVAESVRRMFISDPGYKLYGVDKEQAESRWVGFIIGILFDDWTYLDLLESGDGHTAVARMVWPELPWTGDLKRDRVIAESRFLDPLGETSYRQGCKIIAHGTNILGGPRTIAIETGIPEPLIREFQEKYFAALPGIPRYHAWLATQIQTKQFLMNPFGVRRDFFGRPNDESTIRKAAAHMQASPNAIDVKLGVVNLWTHMGERIQLLTEEHDAIYFQARDDDDEMEIVELVQGYLKNEFDLGFRKFSVPTDVKTGYNKGLRWRIDDKGKKIEINPRGLDKPGAKRN